MKQFSWGAIFLRGLFPGVNFPGAIFSGAFFLTPVLIQIRILRKSEKMNSEEDIVIIIFMNSFNAIHTFTALKMEIILMMRTYYNSDQNLN